MFAYLVSETKTSKLTCVHLSLKPENGISVYYYKSWLKNDESSVGEIQNWISEAKLSKVKSKKNHIKDKLFGYRVFGKINLQNKWLGDLLGMKFVQSSPVTSSGTISVYISLKHKRVEIKLELSEKDTHILKSKLQDHPNFSANPEKETILQNLPDFKFSYIL